MKLNLLEDFNKSEEEMLDDLDTLYTSLENESDYDAIDAILEKNGADPDANTFDVGLNVPVAYRQVIEYFKSKYDSDDLSDDIYEIVYGGERSEKDKLLLDLFADDHIDDYALEKLKALL